MRIDEAMVKAIQILENERPHCGDKSTFTESELCEAYTLALMALRAQTAPKIGRWKQVPIGMSPGGTPGFVCDNCGGSFHLHGAEYPERKLVCDECWQVNSYPWEKVMEITMSDTVSRAAAIDAIDRAVTKEAARWSLQELPFAQPPVSTCDGCKYVGTYDTDFPCSRCIRREKDYYEQER